VQFEAGEAKQGRHGSCLDQLRLLDILATMVLPRTALTLLGSWVIVVEDEQGR
jgi:hypothetical protein